MDEQWLQRRRAQRVRERRRRHLRRRFIAVGALLVAGAAVAVVIASVGNGGRSRRPATRAAAARRPASGRARHPRAKATRRLRPASPRLGPATGRPGNARVPILMYHVIAPPPPGAPYPGLYVPRPEFAAQMHALAHAGWHAVTMDDLRENWTQGRALPSHPIVISFDNGYRSQWADALPVLRRLDWPGVENLQLTGLPPSQGGITPPEVRALIRAGWEIDTQGISHADLVDLDAAQLREQVDDARRALIRRYGVAVDWFCFPSGQYDSTVIAAVRADGYRGATTVVPGWASRADDIFTLPRLRVSAGTAPEALLAQIADARDAPPPPAAYTTSS